MTVVHYDRPDGCCGAYYPETQPLIALKHVDHGSLTPSYKSVPVWLRRATASDRTYTMVTREGLIGRSVDSGT